MAITARRSADRRLDLLAMMRVEARPTLRQLDALRERWEMMDRNGIPRFGELDALVHSDALLDPADPGAAGHRDPPLLGLDLLPSRYGPGYQTSIKGYRGPVAWCMDRYEQFQWFRERQQ